ncbi:MAG: hypothetical protein K8H99_06900 [Nitrospirae bacterium]|nr:hypothetical protein [Fimbriimonadaceae bacterium]
MNKLVVAIGLIMTLAMAAVAEWPCQLDQFASFEGGALQSKCEDLGTRCTWTPLWDYFYKSTRSCNYWCCYDESWNVVGNVYTDCGPWASDGCCSTPNSGWFADPPECTPDS